ncbi:MAG: hypothetical protein HY961_00320 [Ignavibacteriae bacterium]|nr:hypothetical protein [Ignavibacteriota bacterium]
MNPSLIRATRGLYYLREVWNKVVHPASRRNEHARSEFYERLWRTAAEQIGATFKAFGDGYFEIRLRGRRTLIWQGLVQVDDPVTLKLAGNKPMVHKLLAEKGIRVPRHAVFTVDALAAAKQFLYASGGACVVKPAADTGAGDGVTTHVRTESELHRAIAFASIFSSTLMIEEQIRGDSYRLLYFDGTLLHALHRKPPHVVGDGKSTVRQLIAAENNKRQHNAGSAAVTRLHLDPDCTATLRASGLSVHSVLPRGQEIAVKTVVNENSKEDNLTVTSLIEEQLIREGALAAETLGIRLAAVDVITSNPSLSLAEANGAVIEVNTTPGLHHHYNVANPELRDCIAAPILRTLLGETERG